MTSFRIGIGHDTHRLEPGGPLRIGGLDVPHNRQAVGHSDADVLLHAITDALLGAAALGDIGQWFPDTAAENRGRDSAELLTTVVNHLAQAGYQVVNLDTIVFAQRPKLAPFHTAIRQRLAGLLHADISCISLKAKTGELVGPVGREEAIEAQAVVLLERSPPSSE